LSRKCRSLRCFISEIDVKIPVDQAWFLTELCVSEWDA